MYRHTDGFTLIEVLVVMGVVAILLLITTQSLFQSQAAANLDTTVTEIRNDIRQQQLYAMEGATSSAELLSNYSVYFSATSYTLFAGDSYSSTNATNYTAPLSGPVRIVATTFPNNTVTFARLSGDVSGFVSGQDSVTVEDVQSGASRVIQLNRYGVMVH